MLHSTTSTCSVVGAAAGCADAARQGPYACACLGQLLQHDQAIEDSLDLLHLQSTAYESISVFMQSPCP
jgi:hypothetical protein